jgi:hypothetical protein
MWLCVNINGEHPQLYTVTVLTVARSTTLCGALSTDNHCTQEWQVAQSCETGIYRHYTTNALVHVTQNIVAFQAVSSMII